MGRTKRDPCKDLAREIRSCMGLMGIDSLPSLAEATGISYYRLRVCMADPGKFTFGELVNLIPFLKAEITIGGKNDRH